MKMLIFPLNRWFLFHYLPFLMFAKFCNKIYSFKNHIWYLRKYFSQKSTPDISHKWHIDSRKPDIIHPIIFISRMTNSVESNHCEIIEYKPRMHSQSVPPVENHTKIFYLWMHMYISLWCPENLKERKISNF